MSTMMLHKKKWIAAITLAGAAGLLASCQTMMMGGEEVSLTGADRSAAGSDDGVGFRKRHGQGLFGQREDHRQRT